MNATSALSSTTQRNLNHGNTFMVGRPTDALHYMKITNDLESWIDDLHTYLRVHGISHKECENIACHRLSNVFKQLSYREFDMSDAFPPVCDKEHAISIFIADFRHIQTNYDIWCYQHKREIETMSKSQIHARWKSDCPEESAKLDNRMNVLMSTHRRPRIGDVHPSSEIDTPPTNEITAISDTTKESAIIPAVEIPTENDVESISTVETKMLSQKDILREKLNDLMRTSIVLIKFSNRRFNEEIAKATNCLSEIPKRKIGGRKTPKNDNWITFYDKFHGMYRSITVNSVKEYLVLDKSMKLNKTLLQNMIKVSCDEKND